MPQTRLANGFLWTLSAGAVCLAVATICLSRVNLELLPAILLGSGALAAAALSFMSPYFRLLVYVGGALLVMQSSNTALSALKPVYLVFIVFSGLAGVLAIRKLSQPIRESLIPVFSGALLLLALIAAETVLSIVGGEDPARVFRDATTYIMIAVAPLIACAAGQKGTAKGARVTTGMFTLIAAVGFAVYWLSARGVSSLGIERLGMFSFVLAAAGFAVGLAYGIVQRKLVWLALGLICLLCVLVTGTRTGLIMLVGLIAFISPKGTRRVPPWQVIVGLAVLVLAAAFALPALASALGSQDFLLRRVEALTSVFANGVSADQSGAIRERAFSITMDLWSDHPAFGVGFGHLFPSPVPALPPTDFQLDSPALPLAKFGTIGSATLLIAFAMVTRGIARFHVRVGASSEAQSAGLALVLICVGISFLGLPMEDKGFALSFALVFYLLIVESRSPRVEASAPKTMLISDSRRRSANELALSTDPRSDSNRKEG